MLAAHRDLGAHAVCPEAVELAFLKRVRGHQAETEAPGHAYPGTGADFTLALRLDAGLAQHALQPVDRAGRGAEAAGPSPP